MSTFDPRRLPLSCVLSLSLASAGAAQYNHIYTFPAAQAAASAAAGDVDNDGYTDVIVGNADHDSAVGRVEVYSGKDSRVLLTIDGAPRGAATFGEGFGFWVDALDIDMDGHDDFAVSATGADPSATKLNAGAVRVYSGKTGALLFAVEGDAAGDSLGGSVAAAGDVNKDGFPDLVIGAWRNGANGTGYVRVISGKDQSVIATVDGPADPNNRGFFGISVAAAGDVDNDGWADVVIGASNLTVGANADAGRAFVYSGLWLTLKTGTAVLHTFDGSQAGESLGRRTTGLGDINNDNHADIAVASPFWNGSLVSSVGKVTVFSGKDGTVLATVFGMGPDWLGYTALTSGDLNGDGVSDLITGGRFNSGHLVRAYSGVDLATGTATSFLTVSPPSYGALINFVSFGGDVNNDGANDLMIAFAGDRTTIEPGGTCVLSSATMPLSTDRTLVSINEYTRVNFFINAGFTNRTFDYWIFGSASGTSPGVTLSGVTVPLNPDPYTDFTIAFANTPNLVRFRGSLLRFGFTSAQLWVPPIKAPSLIGTCFHHAYVAFDPGTGQWKMASNPVVIRFVQ